ADVLVAAAEAGTGADGVLVVGEGPDRPGLEARARQGHLPVRFVGYQADVSPFLAAADVFVQPSRSEGLPFAALEAMAHGLPVGAAGVGARGRWPASGSSCRLRTRTRSPAHCGGWWATPRGAARSGRPGGRGSSATSACRRWWQPATRPTRARM